MRAKQVLYQSQLYTYKQLSQVAYVKFDNQIDAAHIRHRMDRGWSVEEAIKRPVTHERGQAVIYWYISGKKHNAAQVEYLADAWKQGKLKQPLDHNDLIRSYFAMHLTEAIKQSKLKRIEVAKQAQVQPTNLYNYMTGKRVPNLITAVRLIQVLYPDCQPKQLKQFLLV